MTTDTVRPRVALFATCLVDMFRPSVGFAAAKLIEQSGCDVEVPHSQTCCGQPAYNSGDRKGAIAIASQVVETFADYDYVVAPSGSCAGMIKSHIPTLFEDGSALHTRARMLADKTHELISFLVDVRGMTQVNAHWNGRATYHDSCSGLRELGVKSQPRQLLGSVEGLELTEMENSEVCCGFGGTFAVKYSEISNAMVERKTETAGQTKPDLLLAGDLGCLMNMAGKITRDGKPIEVRHIAEVLAGMADEPAIAGSGK